MRGFLVLCLVAAATADKLGYNYQPVGHDVAVDAGFARGISSSSIGGGFSSNSGSGSHGIGGGAGGGIAGGLGSGFGGFVGGNDAGSFVGTGSSSSSGVGFDGGAQIAPSEFNKEFYTYSAPEEEFNDNGASENIASALKRNLRVVFIRAPENQALTNAALQLAKQASEDRTAIYVLNKQADIGDLANKLQSLKSSEASKPEVHFVKYRTPEDAARAQHAIQAQYETLGGQSHISNEGVAPVLNFASPAATVAANVAPAAGIGGGVLPSQSSSSSSSPSSHGDYAAPRTAYLPSALRLK